MQAIYIYFLRKPFKRGLWEAVIPYPIPDPKRQSISFFRCFVWLVPLSLSNILHLLFGILLLLLILLLRSHLNRKGKSACLPLNNLVLCHVFINIFCDSFISLTRMQASWSASLFDFDTNYHFFKSLYLLFLFFAISFQPNSQLSMRLLFFPPFFFPSISPTVFFYWIFSLHVKVDDIYILFVTYLSIDRF